MGPEIVHLDLQQLLAGYERADDSKAEVETRILVEKVGKVTATRDEIKRSIKLYFALKDMVAQNSLDAIGVRCWPELWERKLSICYALARLSDEGVPGIDENDVTGGLAQLIMHWLTGTPTFLGDLSAIYPERNALQLWHCGAAPLRLAYDLRKAKIALHRLGKGALVEFPLKAGRVTLAKLGRQIKGEFRMLILTGTAIESTSETGNGVEVRLDAPIGKVLDLWISQGFEHHIALVYGEIKEELLELCHILDIKAVAP